jgi:hypothetical protein
MRRNALGIIAAFLIVIGAITTISGPKGSAAVTFAGNCIRAGVVLGALWLALPQIQATLARTPGWVLGWFVGKTKQSDKVEGATPPTRPRRPRRRSST